MTGGFIPSVVRIESGKPHDAKMADVLTKDMICGDILLADRAYVDFGFLHGLTTRKVFWVLRQKVNDEIRADGINRVRRTIAKNCGTA